MAAAASPPASPPVAPSRPRSWTDWAARAVTAPWHGGGTVIRSRLPMVARSGSTHWLRWSARSSTCRLPPAAVVASAMARASRPRYSPSGPSRPQSAPGLRPGSGCATARPVPGRCRRRSRGPRPRCRAGPGPPPTAGFRSRRPRRRRPRRRWQVRTGLATAAGRTGGAGPATRATAPGTVTAQPPTEGTKPWPLSGTDSGSVRRPEHPLPLSTATPSPVATTAIKSPPTPVPVGSTTPMTASAPIAASTADPPARSSNNAARVASAWPAATAAPAAVGEWPCEITGWESRALPYRHRGENAAGGRYARA